MDRKPGSTGDGRRAGRPRNPGTDRIILAAARKLLAEGGLEALRFEVLADMAGVSRPTIYRRWASKPDLVNEIAYGGDDPFPARPIGDLRQAIRFVFEQLRDHYAQPDVSAAAIGAIVMGQKEGAAHPPALAVEAERTAREALRAMIEDGKARGLVRGDADADALFDIAVGAILYRGLFSADSRPRHDVEPLVDIVMAGLQP